MDVQISGSAALIQEVENAIKESEAIAIRKCARRREAHGELQLGVKEIADIIGSVKDLAELAPILWAAAAALWGKFSGTREAPKGKSPQRLLVEIRSPLKEMKVAITPSTTVQEIEIQLK